MRDLISVFLLVGGSLVRTFGEFPSVELAGFELDRDYVAEGFVEELYWDS